MPRTVLVHRVIARLNVGGPAMHVVHATLGVDAGTEEGLRFRTRLIAGSVPPTEGDMGYYAAERGVEPTYLAALSREISALDDLRTLWALWRLFRRERPAVVHTHTAKAGTLGRLAATLAGVPVRIHTFHGHVLGGGYFAPWKTRLFLEIERQLARASDRLVVLTERQAREMSGPLAVAPAAKFAVVPLGLELARFGAVERTREARARARGALGIPEGVRAVGIVGRLVPIKNHELFLDAVAAAREADASIVGVVVGSGEREAELRARAASLGLQEGVLWLGWRRDLPEVYAALDALALTSHDEGTPVAVLEALAAGVPVVARDVGGVGEVLEGVGAGMILPRAADAATWASALRAAASGSVPAEARRRLVEHFSVERLSRDLRALYREALAAHGGP